MLVFHSFWDKLMNVYEQGRPQLEVYSFILDSKSSFAEYGNGSIHLIFKQKRQLRTNQLQWRDKSLRKMQFCIYFIRSIYFWMYVQKLWDLVARIHKFSSLCCILYKNLTELFGVESQWLLPVPKESAMDSKWWALAYVHLPVPCPAFTRQSLASWSYGAFIWDSILLEGTALLQSWAPSSKMDYRYFSSWKSS